MASTIADSMWLRALILAPSEREHKTLFGRHGGDGYAGDRGGGVARDRGGAPRLARDRAGPRARVAHALGLLPVLYGGGARSVHPVRALAVARLAPVHPRVVLLPSELSERAPGGPASVDHGVCPLRGDGVPRVEAAGGEDDRAG